ncbi:MAG: hypothetical protein DRG76_11160 [Deltaproteobacteria bacterium]|nr:MAG: hypothetical protein DRG76_11160 [Deltaproteobacteria bacterium]
MNCKPKIHLKHRWHTRGQGPESKKPRTWAALRDKILKHRQKNETVYMDNINEIQDTTVLQALQRNGPMIGSELMEATGAEGLELWRTCMSSEKICTCSIARHYLRLDRRVEGFARLSPSIFREFLTYTVVGLKDQAKAVEKRAEEIRIHIRRVSRSKLALARSVISGLVSKLDSEFPLQERTCVLIAGDIVFDMAHDVPRPERSTGRLVNGSDMDIVVIVDERFPHELRKRIDDTIFAEKYRLLMTPHLREEIDYVVKDLGKVTEQLCFDTFKHMVACKIMHEGELLFGSKPMFQQIKGMLEKEGVVKKLLFLEQRAWQFRQEACERLCRYREDLHREDILCLFYPTEESEEFE